MFFIILAVDPSSDMWFADCFVFFQVGRLPFLPFGFVHLGSVVQVFDVTNQKPNIAKTSVK